MESQLSLSFAKRGRDNAMAHVEGKANRECPGWSDDAHGFLLDYLDNVGDRPFMTEDVRLASAGKVDEPHDTRAWGGVIRRAVSAGILQRVGFAPSKTGHCRPMPLWRKTLAGGASLS